MTAAEIVGVLDPHGEHVRGELYEFWTDGGLHVYLHDADLRRITYEPGRPPALAFEFLQEPLALSDQSWITVDFRFEDVRIHNWHDDPVGHCLASENDDASPGQVDGVYWNGQDYFTLDSFLVQVDFTAARVTVKAHEVKGPGAV